MMHTTSLNKFVMRLLAFKLQKIWFNTKVISMTSFSIKLPLQLLFYSSSLFTLKWDYGIESDEVVHCKMELFHEMLALFSRVMIRQLRKDFLNECLEHNIL